MYYTLRWIDLCLPGTRSKIIETKRMSQSKLPRVSTHKRMEWVVAD